jgi:Protein of unknown function (DUF4019)
MQTTEAEEQAGASAAEQWLALVDAGDFEESWEHTASNFKSGIIKKHFFKSGTSKQQWQSALRTVQDSLGKVVLRLLKSKRYTTELPWELAAEYVVIEYETTFERQMNRTEIVILMKESDGEWRVSGYRFKTGPSNKLLHRTAR